MEETEDLWDGMSEEEEKEMWAEHESYKREQLNLGAKNAIKQRCKGDTNYSLNRFWRWFYTFKCLFCYLYEWEFKPDTTHRQHGDWRDQYPDVVAVADISFQRTYAGWDAAWLEVGYGVFENWFIRVQEDSEWNM